MSTMPRANLTLTVPAGVWIGTVSRAHPDATIRILSALTDDESGVVLAEVTAPSPEAVITDLRDADAVVELDVLQQYDEAALVQFETTVPFLLAPVRESRAPLRMPFSIEAGTVEWELTASHARLSELATGLESLGISFTLDELTHDFGPDRLLTDRQRRLVREAVERGYYDTPRRCTLTELADAMGVAKSTCSETLHRAEGTVMKQFVAEGDGAPFD